LGLSPPVDAGTGEMKEIAAHRSPDAPFGLAESHGGATVGLSDRAELRNPARLGKPAVALSRGTGAETWDDPRRVRAQRVVQSLTPG
jgi:hypothetical protein